jgi:hypothetical protein
MHTIVLALEDDLNEVKKVGGIVIEIAIVLAVVITLFE